MTDPWVGHFPGFDGREISWEISMLLLWTHLWAIFGKSLRFPENRKMMKINTKVLIFSKLHILAEISQNMGNDGIDVMKYPH
jgi:hypothetical protein